MKQALGIIEVRGLATAILIADSLVKVAAVDLIDVEPAKGAGWMTVKITGDVGAVQAAIEAGSSLARDSQQLIATKVIPRPASSVADYFLPKKVAITATKTEKQASDLVAEVAETQQSQVVSEKAILEEPEELAEVKEVAIKKVTEKKKTTKKNSTKK